MAVPAWNEVATVAGVVSGLRTKVPDADVLVVDDGSDDGTAAAAAGAVMTLAEIPQGCSSKFPTLRGVEVSR